MADESINIEFILNTPALLEEYNKMIASGKNVDDSVDAIKKRYQELAAAQVLGVEGARDLADAVKNIGKDWEFTKKGKEFQEGIIQSKNTLDAFKSMLKEIESAHAQLNEELSKTPKGEAYDKIKQEADDLKITIDGYNSVIEQMSQLVKSAEDQSESFAKKQRDVNDELKQLAANGQEGSDRYKELKEKAQEFKEASEKVNNDIKDGNTLLQGQVEGLNMLISTISVAQGVMALLGVEEENLQKIMLKVQSLLAITIGLQQISDALNKNLHSVQLYWQRQRKFGLLPI
ncbi:hypothetical protein EVD20_21845 [Elizabethkingia bruuniana]|nr:hypothetical protein [Elizabethkingia bruuniana]QDZ64573.1 hypothetical protein EVD20_21845 [Elizabethkingia bruuniana]